MKSSILFALFSCVGMLFAQASHKAIPQPKFSELSPDDSQRLNHQRSVVASIVKQRYAVALTRTKADLPTLQRLLDDQAFKKTQIYELQCLGVAFGDVLTSDLPLRWVMITDEFGTDPTLRFKKSSVNVNALTIISKRVERDEHVNLLALLNETRDALSEGKRESH